MDTPMDARENDVEITETASRQTVAIRTVIPMAELDIPELFDEVATRLVTYLEQHDFEADGAPYSRYWEFGPDQADIEVGIPVDDVMGDLDDLGAGGVIGSSELPGGKVARLLHIGPYDDLVQVYERLEAYLAANGLTPAGAPWETYVVMADAVGGNPEQLQTEVTWPIS